MTTRIFELKSSVILILLNKIFKCCFVDWLNLLVDWELVFEEFIHDIEMFVLDAIVNQGCLISDFLFKIRNFEVCFEKCHDVDLIIFDFTCSREWFLISKILLKNFKEFKQGKVFTFRECRIKVSFCFCVNCKSPFIYIRKPI